MSQVPAPPDSLRRVLDAVFDGAAYQWRDESAATVLLRRWRRQFFEWLDLLARDHPTLFQALIWGLVAILALIALHAVWVLVRTTRARPVVAGQKERAGRVVPRDAAWYARLAAALREQGRYAAAMQAEFMRLVLELDGRRVLRYHPSRTPREYLADLAAGPRRAEFGRLVDDLYRYAFAGEPCGRDDLASWASRADAERYAPAG